MTFTEQMHNVLESYIETQATPMLATSQSRESVDTLKTPFGDVLIDEARAITFEKGIPGLEEAKVYALAYMPDPKLSSYLMLQSLDYPELTLVTLPMDPKIELVEDTDIHEAIDSLDLEMDNALFLLLVSVHEKPEPSVTVNLKAPLIIDAKTLKGVQYIFPNNKYDVRYKIR